MHPYVQLAKEAVELWVKEHKKPDKDVKKSPLFERKSACFCTIYKNKELRGCIGTIFPLHDSLYEEIIENAISAATRDPRFEPVRVEELNLLEYKVDVLSEISPVKDLNKLNPKINGIIVKQGSKQALLLPDLEGIDSVEDQIRIVKMKAGIFNDLPCEYFTFTVERYS
ncbi:MAG: AmmeMemoRadiSam system protein A [Thermodesulfobium narugense]|nr:MAG: AmmeMemoRadiSam system protein A [Thermodesulfobium narugense]